MAYDNYIDMTLRASSASSGTSDQEAAVTLPESVREMFVTVTKTAEANADNVLSVRIQAQIDSSWVDLPYDYVQETQTLTTAADIAALTTRVPNIVDGSTDDAFTVVGYYSELPSNVVRCIWVASGTTPSHTFSVIASFPLNRF